METSTQHILPSALSHRLQSVYPKREAGNLARLLCVEVLGQSSADYYLDKGMTLSPNTARKWEAILIRLLQKEPVQYVLGEARFLRRTFHVTPAVLIPRPETEELVELILAELPLNTSSRLLDIGTGSGCIAVSLSVERPHAEVFAWELSPEALAVARENNRLLSANVRFEQCDVLTREPREGEQYDLIVSNPPYITEREQHEMERNVLDYEPHTALFVPDTDPLRFYRRIALLGKVLLTAAGTLCFEINRAYGDETVNLLHDVGYRDIRLLQDISHNPRFIIARR
jgi:release factor glutamine methyltransferase